ncbi:MAG: ABC transporter ATP-binding protein [Zoogloeaceae bacterium]|jgi:peptide/nickel transport system ATP-binding protein|nr:ABC transporter ATP-binding protein [Zoogloeaceae bacterium]
MSVTQNVASPLQLVFPVPLLEVENLEVAFRTDAPVVQKVSFQIARGECLALVGESGSGKSVTSRALVGLAGEGAHVSASRLVFAGQDLHALPERAWNSVRGARIGFVMQDATGSLDPLRKVGKEVGETLALHTCLDAAQRRARVLELLRSVGVPEAEVRAAQYPHQLSGGLRQRAMIASSIACAPDLLIADEPTTALDTLVQAQVLELLEHLRDNEHAMLIVSHDLAVVARLAHRIAVMRHGEIVEQGLAAQILEDPRHPYTQSLLRAASAIHLVGGVERTRHTDRPPVERLTETADPILVEARALEKYFVLPDGAKKRAVASASFVLRAGETLGIVGESGSGKTTLTRMVLGLERPDQGEVFLRGNAWTRLPAKRQRQERRRIQVVFQDPLASFDPRYTVARVLEEARAINAAPRHTAVELLDLVRLSPTLLSRRPIELSGGQRQRIAIARALAADPEVLVCDEAVSALDASVQAQILDLLADLKLRLGLACLFISHDLGVIHHICNRVLVMKDGEIVESGRVDEVFYHPRHPYTQSLLGAIPRLPERIHQVPQAETFPEYTTELYGHA